MESNWAIATGCKIWLSEQQLDDCQDGSSGDDGGCQDCALEDFYPKHKACTRDSYAYTGVDGTCMESSCTAGVPQGDASFVEVGDPSIDIGSGPNNWKGLQGSVASMKSALAGHTITAHVAADDFGQFYSSGVVTTQCGATDTDHGVITMGYGTDNGVAYFKIRNSWGSDWGENGYIRLGQSGNTACMMRYTTRYSKINPSTSECPPPPPAPPAPPSPPGPPGPPGPSTWYKTITQSNDNRLCLDLPGGDTTQGTALWMWECNGGESQRWVFDSYQLRYGADESKCVDAGDTSNGNQAVLWECNGYPQQDWSYDSDASRIYLSNTGTCMDFYADQQWNGQPVHTWECNGQQNQEWTLWNVDSSSANTATSVSEILVV